MKRSIALVLGLCLLSPAVATAGKQEDRERLEQMTKDTLRELFQASPKAP